MSEWFLSLRAAERLTGISRRTLRAWLEDAGLAIPTVARGSKLLISQADLAAALSLHAPARFGGSSSRYEPRAENAKGETA